MLHFVGDVHGEWWRLKKAIEDLPNPHGTIVQVGDMGIWPGTVQRYPSLDEHIYYLDGNHEYFPMLDGENQPLENATHLKRGSIIELNGYRIGCLGGGYSLDKAFRTPGFDWFPEEAIKLEEAQRLLDTTVDILVTHVPPQEVIVNGMFEGVFGVNILRAFGLPSTFVDPNSPIVQEVWNALDRPPLFCGHMHKSFEHENCRVLGIGEVVTYP